MTTLIVVVLLGVVIAWAGCITASSGRTHLRRPELAWLRGGAVVTLSVPVALHLHALTAVWYVSTTTYDDASHGQTVVTVGSSSGMAQLMTLAVVASGVLSALSVYGRRDWSALGLACAWLLLAFTWLVATFSWDEGTSDFGDGLVQSTSAVALLTLASAGAALVRFRDSAPKSPRTPGRQPGPTSQRSPAGSWPGSTVTSRRGPGGSDAAMADSPEPYFRAS